MGGCCDLNMKQASVSFYALRHTFETIAGETHDQAAVSRIMGHEDPSMAGQYREWLGDAREDERLRKVTEHARLWLEPWKVPGLAVKAKAAAR